MKKNKRKELPTFTSFDNLVEFVETHDMGEYWDQLPEAQFEVDLKRNTHLVQLDSDLATEIQRAARLRHTSAPALLNSWIRERLSRNTVSTTREETRVLFREDESELPSQQYWRIRHEGPAQRFYVAFCLLMSSIQDSILAEKERESNNFNWAATCSYYSLVHGGRLLCFLGLGDYYKSHRDLRLLFLGHSQRKPFDWLRGFADVATGINPQDTQHPASSRTYRNWIAGYFDQVLLPQGQERLSKFGIILDAAGKLRNDSNYEPLLIAHEYQHRLMSEAFEKLSRYMATAAESQLTFFIDAFNSFRHHDRFLPAHREAYEEFLHDYVQHRIGNAIRRKLTGSVALRTKLNDIINLIGTASTGAPYHELEHQISIENFSSKSRLMHEFESHIRDLEREMTKSNGDDDQ